MFPPRGSCVMVKIAHTGLSLKQIMENILNGLQAIAQKLPRKWKVIQSVNIKTPESVALPIYTSLPEPDFLLSTDSKKRKREESEEEEEAEEEEESSSEEDSSPEEESSEEE